MITPQHVEIVRIIGLTAIGITFMICWTWLRVANKKYRKECKQCDLQKTKKV